MAKWQSRSLAAANLCLLSNKNLLALETADAGELEPFITLIGHNLVRSLELFLRGARGEAIDEPANFERKLTELQAKLNKTEG